MDRTWTCPTCGAVMGATIFVCDGYGGEDELHADVWMLDVLRGETKEAQALLQQAKEEREYLRDAYERVTSREYSLWRDLQGIQSLLDNPALTAEEVVEGLDGVVRRILTYVPHPRVDNQVYDPAGVG